MDQKNYVNIGSKFNFARAWTRLPNELQIEDDGWTDNAEEVVREFAETSPFLIYSYRSGKNLNYGENFLRTGQRCTTN